MRDDVVARLRAAGCVFAEDEARLLTGQARDGAELAALVARRVAGEPLEQVLGWAEFAGIRVTLAPGVFVPRRRSELLIEQAVARAGRRRPLVVLDLCCGSGALGLALTRALGGDVELHAADIDPAAVACARANLAGVGGRVHLGDLYEPLPPSLAGRVDLLLTVTPYVPTPALPLMPPEARDHEPRRALDGGPDGLAVLRRVAMGAPHWLAPGGALLTETGADQATEAAAVLAAHGLSARPVYDEERGAMALIAACPDDTPTKIG